MASETVQPYPVRGFVWRYKLQSKTAEHIQSIGAGARPGMVED